MVQQPHQDLLDERVGCALVTVSDTRSIETDRSGQLLKKLLLDAGHSVVVYTLVKDEPAQIQEQLQQLVQHPDLDAVILNGGTGIAPRDTTYDAIEQLLDKQLPGFGELFRFLSYQEVGSRAIASRAVAGVYQNKLVFSLPGSANAVQLATEKLILPELIHLVQQLREPH
ncbi:MAG TPA: MogA/MoaB family molybdenum cofactor biosynthesis protein [Candidatus Caenarcaniphilales bacterium]